MARLDDWKARFPALVFDADDNATGYKDAQITQAYEDMDGIYATDDAAKAYAVAHWLEAQTPGGEATTFTPDGAGIATTMKPVAESGSDSFWATTAYGLRFLMLRRNAVAFSLRSL